MNFYFYITKDNECEELGDATNVKRKTGFVEVRTITDILSYFSAIDLFFNSLINKNININNIIMIIILVYTWR